MSLLTIPSEQGSGEHRASVKVCPPRLAEKSAHLSRRAPWHVFVLRGGMPDA